MKSLQDIWADRLNYLRIIMSLIFIIIAFSMYVVTLSDLAKTDFYIKYHIEFLFEILVHVFFSLAIIILIYEKYIHKSFAELVKQKVLESQLLTLDVLETLRSDKLEDGIKNLLCVSHGDDLGGAFYKLRLRKDKLNFHKSKENFAYNITLESHPELEHFFKAYFKIEFDSIMPNKILEIENTYAKDGFAFQNLYSTLIKKKESIYRYILLTEREVEMGDSIFQVKDFYITFGSGKSTQRINFTWNSEFSDHTLRIKFTPKEKSDKKFIRKIKGDFCRFNLNIETIVDKNIHAFPVRLGYPVKNFVSSLTAVEGTGINSIDIIDVLNAADDYKKSQPLRIAGAQVEAPGWVIPDSGLVFIWK